ncbi:MAG: peptidoglycan binding domain-containing protein, partial [Actinobacteria bacterium]|nr:peptidoglycan binding domain-containing protein [Actinomycetota bacterium]
MMVKALSGGGEIEPVVTIDDRALARAVDALAERAEIKPADGAVRFSRGEVKTTPAVLGRVIDREQAMTALREAFL